MPHATCAWEKAQGQVYGKGKKFQVHSNCPVPNLTEKGIGEEGDEDQEMRCENVRAVR